MNHTSNIQARLTCEISLVSHSTISISPQILLPALLKPHNSPPPQNPHPPPLPHQPPPKPLHRPPMAQPHSSQPPQPHFPPKPLLKRPHPQPLLHLQFPIREIKHQRPQRRELIYSAPSSQRSSFRNSVQGSGYAPIQCGSRCEEEARIPRRLDAWPICRNLMWRLRTQENRPWGEGVKEKSCAEMVSR